VDRDEVVDQFTKRFALAKKTGRGTTPRVEAGVPARRELRIADPVASHPPQGVVRLVPLRRADVVPTPPETSRPPDGRQKRRMFPDGKTPLHEVERVPLYAK